MKKLLLTGLICIGVIYISYSIGYQIGRQKSHDAILKDAGRAMLINTAYSASLSLQTEMQNHQFIKSGNTTVAEQFSLDRIDIIIKQIEGIDYSNTAFETEINKNLAMAKEYVKSVSH